MKIFNWFKSKETPHETMAERKQREDLERLKEEETEPEQILGCVVRTIINDLKTLTPLSWIVKNSASGDRNYYVLGNSAIKYTLMYETYCDAWVNIVGIHSDFLTEDEQKTIRREISILLLSIAKEKDKERAKRDREKLKGMFPNCFQ